MSGPYLGEILYPLAKRSRALLSRISLAFALLPVAVLTLPTRVLAQVDGGVPGPTDPNDPAATASALMDAIAHKQWWPVASLSVVLITWLVRGPLANTWPSVKTFTDHPVVAWLMPTIVSLVGATATQAMSAGHLDVMGLVFSVLKVSFGAIAIYTGAKKIQEARSAGADAAATIDSKAAAVDSFKKDPPKGGPNA